MYRGYTWSAQYQTALYLSYKYEITNEKLYFFHEGLSGAYLEKDTLSMKQGLEFESGWLVWADD